jgi:ribosomal protein L11 methyltransferase
MASMITDWVDVEIRSTLDAGEVLGLLGDPSVRGAWQDDRAIHLYWPGSTWSSARLAQLRWVLGELAGNRLLEPDIVVHALPDRDWNRQWAESVKPLWVGKRLVIRPTWERVDTRSHQIEIILDPKRAFGTGHHATTRMLLEWLEDIIHGGESVLDVGTGSGILAMVEFVWERLGPSEWIMMRTLWSVRGSMRLSIASALNSPCGAARLRGNDCTT